MTAPPTKSTQNPRNTGDCQPAAAAMPQMPHADPQTMATALLRVCATPPRPQVSAELLDHLERIIVDERWLPVPGFESAYRISDHGNVLSVARRCGGRNRYTEFQRRVPAKMLQPRRSSDGRLVVELCRDGRGEKV